MTSPGNFTPPNPKVENVRGANARVAPDFADPNAASNSGVLFMVISAPHTSGQAAMAEGLDSPEAGDAPATLAEVAGAKRSPLRRTIFLSLLTHEAASLNRIQHSQPRLTDAAFRTLVSRLTGRVRSPCTRREFCRRRNGGADRSLSERRPPDR
jgi:hypothetical protein